MIEKLDSQLLNLQKTIEGLKERREEFKEVNEAYVKIVEECEHFGLTPPPSDSIDQLDSQISEHVSLSYWLLISSGKSRLNIEKDSEVFFHSTRY